MARQESKKGGARKRGATKATNGKDAIAILKADHREVEDLFETFENTDDEDSQHETAMEICAALTVHATVEEELFYPAIRDAVPDLAELLDEAEVEHGTLKDLIAEIEGREAGDPMFRANVKVLSEYVRHHVQEEEKKIMPKVKQADLDLTAMGEEIRSRREELQEDSGSSDDSDDEEAVA